MKTTKSSIENTAKSVGPKMAETTLRTFWCILALLFILPTVITSVLSIKTKEEKENSVTFVGFVNDHQNKFSALLEVEILASRLPPPRANDANHGKNKDNNNFGLWLASEDPESCIGKAVYGRAKVEPVHDGGLFGVGLNCKRKIQIFFFVIV